MTLSLLLNQPQTGPPYFALFTGTLAPTGALRKTVVKRLAGGLTPTGALFKTGKRAPTGSITPTGALKATPSKRLTGTLAPTGQLITTFHASVLSVELFDLGVAGFTSVEPFDIEGELSGYTSIEPFRISGSSGFLSIEPFDFGGLAGLTSVEFFDITDAGDMILPTYDLGDGDSAAAPGTITYGWWLPDEDGLEDLGPIVTD